MKGNTRIGSPHVEGALRRTRRFKADGINIRRWVLPVLPGQREGHAIRGGGRLKSQPPRRKVRLRGLRLRALVEGRGDLAPTSTVRSGFVEVNPIYPAYLPPSCDF